MSRQAPRGAINPYRLWTGAFLPNWLLSKPELTPNEKILYARLCQYAGRHGYAYPSVARLADDLAVSERTIFASIRKLREAGLIEVVDRKAEGRSSLYYFLEHEWMHSGPLPSEPGDANLDGAGSGPTEVPLEPTGTEPTGFVAKTRKHLNAQPPEADFRCHLQEGRGKRNTNKKRQVTPSVDRGSKTTPPDPDFRREVKIPALATSLRKRSNEEMKDRAPRTPSFQALEREMVESVLAKYDEIFIEVHGKHYVHTQRDLQAALTLWLRADDLARVEVQEKSLGESAQDEVRSKVIDFWLRKLAKREGFVAQTGWCLWTANTTLTELGTPFRVQRRKPRERQEQFASPEDLAAMWSGASAIGE
mgnify:CR=1 FL=1